MVKFSKELEAQLVPEWKEAFVNYRQLKKHVKRMKLSRNPKLSPESSYELRRSIGGIIDRIFGCRIAGERELDSIKIKNKTSITENKIEEEEESDQQRGLSQLFSLEDEVKSFLDMLDDELTKVSQFHAIREAEFLERGDILKNQLLILLDVKSVTSHRRLENWPPKLSDIFPRSTTSSLQSSDRFDINDSGTADVIAALEENGINFVNSAKLKKSDLKTSFRINIPPTGTIAAATTMIWEDLFNNPKKVGEVISRRQLQCAEKMIRSAFVELYRGLGLLKTYSGLNMLAFSKILKKFRKVSSCHEIANNCLLTIKESNFITSDKVVKLMDDVESLFTENFANNDRRMTLKYLKPQLSKESSSHMVTFFVGLFTGSFVTLFSAYIILSHANGVFSSRADTSYMEIIYPLFSIFTLFSLHLFMYGCNLLMWKHTRINHNFIFDFQANSALNYRDAFLICTSMMTCVVGAMVLHLLLIYKFHFPRHKADLIPAILVAVYAVILVCPFNVLYRSSRYSFLRIIRNIVCSPFYKVVMVDFFMADQLTSQIPLLRHIESAACYFIAKNIGNTSTGFCKSERMFMDLAYVISFAPYYWRAMQCARRWFDESHVDHLANLGKYISAMVAAGARLTYSRQPTLHLKVTVIGTSLIATVYQLYWDFVKDWGLMKPNSRNPWLRDELVLKNRGIYYGSIVLNFILRVAWIQTIVRFEGGMLESHVIEFLFASLEIIRRGHWNYYRLENEHLNNVGRFRAVKSVPLPFHEDDI